MTETDGMK